MEKKWWHNKIAYQIYPKSFYDSNQDGIGDLPGITAKLDYLKDLGVDILWISPVYVSPLADQGYDIADYQKIDPRFGTMEDMDRLLKEAKARHMYVLMDLVVNHCSDEHTWFRKACQDPEGPYGKYFYMRKSRDGSLPTNWRSYFGGPAWEWVPQIGQYYFHQFSVKQPDLNWENPKVRQEIYDMILWWMAKGVGGFRLDVIDQIAKEPDRKITNNGPRLHEFLQEMSRETFQKGDLLTVGEAWGANTENAKLYSNPDGSEFSMVFQFEHVMLDQQEGKEKWDLAPLSLVKLKKNLAKWQDSLYGCGWNSLFWDNHDLPRIVSRWGDDQNYRVESAKMLAAVLHGMQGTPYIYQGEELGMTNVQFADIEEYRDIEIHNMYRERLDGGYTRQEVMESIYAKGRDNARTPMQWNDQENAGFTTGTPWIRVNPNYRQINMEQERKDPGSVFSFYRRLVHLRKEEPIFVEGRFELLLPEDEQIFAYTRTLGSEQMLVCANFSGQPAKCGLIPQWKNARELLHNYEGDVKEELRPYEVVILIRR